MAEYSVESITLGDTDNSFKAIKRGHRLFKEEPTPNEVVFITAGEYAIHRPTGGQWQLFPAELWPGLERFDNLDYPRRRLGDWATAEALRTMAGQNAIFLPDHMDLIETTQVKHCRITNEENELVVASEGELSALLEEYRIPTAYWQEAGLRDLYHSIGRGAAPWRENVTLHDVGGKLWLAAAQTILNAYRTNAAGHTERLQEIQKTNDDHQENVQPKPRIIERTGRILDNRPERPFGTARRVLSEELGIEGRRGVKSATSIGSILRQKKRGHPRFPPISAEEHIHYFDIHLEPKETREEYLNQGGNSATCTDIKLEWLRID